jgi:PAS domain S-box-containing protein
MSINLHDLRERAVRALELSGQKSELAPEFEGLLEELRIYQTELEIQNQELQHAQAKLATTLARYRTLYQQMPLPALLINQRGFVVEANLQAQQLFHLPQSGSLIYRAAMKLVAASGREALWRLLNQKRAAGDIVTGIELAVEAGEGRIADLHTIQIEGEGIDEDSTLLIVVDRTAEHKLQNEQQLLHRLALQVPGMLFQLKHEADGATKFTYISPRVTKFFGATAAEVQRDVQLIWQRIDEGERPRISESFAWSARTLSPWHEVFRVQLDGSPPRWLESEATPRAEADGVIYWDGYLRDVTRQREIEDALRESQERLQLIHSGIEDGLWDWDLETNHVFFSPQWKRQLGYQDHELKDHIDTFVSLIHAEDQATVAKAIGDYRASQSERYEVEMRLRHRNGSWRWILSRGIHLLDRNGEPYRMIGSHSDITARKESEMALRLSEQRLNEAQELLHLGSWEIDHSNGQIYWSDQLYRIYEVDPENYPLDMDSVVRGVDAADLPNLLETYQRSLATAETVTLIYRLHLPDGRTKYLRTNYRSEMDVHGNLSRTIGTTQDISKSYLLEQRYNEQQASFATILDNSPVGLCLLRERCFVWLNQRLAEFFGYTVEELLGQSIACLYPTHNDFVRLGDEAYPQLMEGKRYVTEQLLHNRDGRSLWARLSGKIIDPAQPQIGSIWVVEDITVQKMREQALIAAQEGAEAANLAKSRFLATMSHEIRTPMNGILGMAQLLQLAELPQHERLEFAQTILSSGHALLGLLNDILDLSRIEAGKLELDIVTFEPSQLLREVMMLYQAMANNKGITLEIEWLGEERQRYLADLHRLHQMLNNLVGNAVKFTHRGRVRIVARELGEQEGAMIVEFAVIDSGPGIEAERLSLLFKPFSQADTTISRQFGGSGLGLSIVDRLAQLMGGSAGVESQLGVGSTFWIRIPCHPVGANHDPHKVTSGRAASVNELRLPGQLNGRVLVAEDNEINLRVITSLLTRIGLTVDAVTDGADAVAHLQRGDQIDLVLLDIEMPILDGHGAAQQIRTWEEANGLARHPIIALTANAFPADRQASLAAGMDAHINKPIEFLALYELMRQWLPSTANAADRPVLSEEVTLDLAQLLSQVSLLRRYIEGNRFDALTLWHQIEASCRHTPLAAAFEPMAEALTAIDFPQALRHLDELISTQGWELEFDE